MKINSICFFYNSECIEVSENIEILLDSLEKYYNKHLKEHKLNYQEYFNQLDKLINQNTIDSMSSLFIMNIFVLTKMSKLIQDEYNGILYFYEN